MSSEQNAIEQIEMMKTIKDTELNVNVVVMEKELSIGELKQLSPGSMLPFNLPATTPAHLYINNKNVAHGTVVENDNHYALQINNLCKS